MELIINPELENFLPPISEEKKELLLNSLINNGCIEPIITWNGVIVDGHNRYEICKELDIPFECVEKEFASMEDAKFFIIEKHIANREFTVFQKCELVYPFEPIITERIANRKREKVKNYRRGIEVCQKTDEPQDTGSVMAKYAGISRDTWYRAKALIENADETTKEHLRTGKIKINPAYNDLKKKPADDDYDDSEDQRLLEKIRAMPKENTTDPRADDTIKDEVQIPTEEIGGYEPVVYQKSPITVSEEPIKRIPGDFYYVEEQVRSSMRNMLDDLKIGLCWLRDEDCNRRDEIISIIDEGFAEAKKLIEKETRRII